MLDGVPRILTTSSFVVAPGRIAATLSGSGRLPRSATVGEHPQSSASASQPLTRAQTETRREVLRSMGWDRPASVEMSPCGAHLSRATLAKGGLLSTCCPQPFQRLLRDDFTGPTQPSAKSRRAGLSPRRRPGAPARIFHGYRGARYDRWPFRVDLLARLSVSASPQGREAARPAIGAAVFRCDVRRFRPVAARDGNGRPQRRAAREADGAGILRPNRRL